MLSEVSARCVYVFCLPEQVCELLVGRDCAWFIFVSLQPSTVPGTESQFSQYEFSFLLVTCRENLVDAKDDFHKLTFSLGLTTQTAPFCFLSTKMAEVPGNALLQATLLNYNIEFKNDISRSCVLLASWVYRLSGTYLTRSLSLPLFSRTCRSADTCTRLHHAV